MTTSADHAPSHGADPGNAPTASHPVGAGDATGAAMQHGSWRGIRGLSSESAPILAVTERFLESAGFDRGPWLAVGFGGGIAAWFALANRWQWQALICACLAVALLGLARGSEARHPFTRAAVVAMAIAVAAGCGVVWAKASLFGVPPVPRFVVGELVGRVLAREEEPARGLIRLTLATREPRSGRAIKVRLSLKPPEDRPGLGEGAVVRVRARLMAPRPPQLPGGYDFARAAWFDGLAATGSALAPPQVIAPAATSGLAQLRHALAGHIRAQVPASAGGIAAAFASGDRGGIAAGDDAAMRDAGLTHLLSVSGLHVSAVVGIAYVVVLRLLALFPWLALRVRLPLLASAAGAAVGVGYTLLTGAEVPTVRSCLGALLVMVALAIGRNPLSMRLLAVVAGVVMLLWPEAVVGPSFQMSFGSVIAIVAVAQSDTVRGFLAHRGESWLVRTARHLAMVLLTGIVIDLALMPLALFHFQRAGIYGSLANVVAIPLTTFVTMPLIGLALALDLVGLGGPVWRLVGGSLDGLLWIAHRTAELPGAVTLVPASGRIWFGLFVAGLLWLALWHGRRRLLGLVPAVLAIALIAWERAPDVLVTGDGRNLGIVDADNSRLLILREGRSTFTRDAMMASAGMAGEVIALDDWPGARCQRDACVVTLARGGRLWKLLVLRRGAWVEYPDVRAACAAVDIVVAPQWLGERCRPGMALIDRALLLRTGGLALDLERRRVRTVAEEEGQHPWWRFPSRMPRAEAADTAASAVPGER